LLLSLFFVKLKAMIDFIELSLKDLNFMLFLLIIHFLFAVLIIKSLYVLLKVIFFVVEFVL